MSKRATEDLLAQIHHEVAKAMLETLRGDEPPTAGQISNIIRFLKDNGIEAVPEEGSDVQKIVDALPDFTDDEEEFRTLQ